MLQPIFFDDLSHHLHGLFFAFSLFQDDTVDLGGSSSGCEDGVKAIDSFSDVKDGLTCEVVLILHDDLVVNLMGECVLDVPLEIADGQVVCLAEMRRVLKILHNLSH